MLGPSPEAVIAKLLIFFGVAHSGLASLRPWAEEIVCKGTCVFILLVFLLLLPFNIRIRHDS